MRAAIAFAIVLFAVMFFGIFPFVWLMRNWHGPYYCMSQVYRTQDKGCQ